MNSILNPFTTPDCRNRRVVLPIPFPRVLRYRSRWLRQLTGVCQVNEILQCRNTVVERILRDVR